MKKLQVPMLSGAATLLVLMLAAAAAPIVNIPAEDLRAALDDYIRQSGVQLIYNVDDVTGRTSAAVHCPADEALGRLLDGTGLLVSRDPSGAVVISRAPERRVEADPSLLETVIVTGSRIRGGTELSAPVIRVAAETLLSTTPGGIPEALDKLPIFMAGSTPNNATTGANGRGGNAPGYFLNLRNLGAIRTLILQDGHRVPGTFFDTTVDTDMLPQMLMDRVEVVTSGASAVYGSDAVSGVVNFILDKKFDGLKAIAQGGISQQGDARSLRLGVAGGDDLAGGHLVWSVEYRLRDALPDAAARSLGNLGTSIVGSGTAYNPYTLVRGIRQSNTAPGGLIVSGPGAGLQFLGNGALAPFNPGTPTGTTNFSIGGDGGIEHNEYLLPVFTTGQSFAHYEHAFGNVTAHLEARYAQARSYEAGQIFTNINGSGISTNGSSAQYPITIYSGNAFLSPSAQSVLFPVGGPASFQMNRMDNDLMSRLSLDQHTGALAVGAGLEGSAFDRFTWDINYTHGETRTQLMARNNVNTARFYAALDAVRDPGGNIVCNVTLTNPGAFPGCVPLNLFGQSATVVNGSNASQAALNYVASSTWWVAHNGLDDFSANVTGKVLDGPAGPVRMAVSGEYRLASLFVSTSTPDNSFHPQYLRLAPPGTFAATAASPLGTFPPANLANFKEVQAGARGSENVGEANVEADAPLLRGLPGIALLSVGAAARYTQYNIAGTDPAGGAPVKRRFSASTWKLGVEWHIDDDIRLRGAVSRDIRAPTLWDLFQGPATSTSGLQDSLTGVSGSANTRTIGNPGLQPEVARNTGLGLVYEPQWLPELHLTADYFHISIDREIAGIGGSNPVVQSLCLASPGGSSPYCGLIQRPISYNSTSPLNFPTLYYFQVQNFQRQWTEGVDFELAYQADLAGWQGLDGALSLRLLWTHTAFLKTLGLPGSVITDVAGSANAPGSALPSEKAALLASYTDATWSLLVIERHYGSIRQNPNPTLIYAPGTGDLPAWFQTDVNLTYAVDQQLAAFIHVANLFNAQPDIFQVPGYTGSPGMNYPVVPYEDLIGRCITIGLKFKTG